MVAGEERWGERILGESGMDMDTLLCLKWIAEKDLPCSMRKSVQCYVAG